MMTCIRDDERRSDRIGQNREKKPTKKKIET